MDVYSLLDPLNVDIPIQVVRFSATPPIAEFGSTVSSVVLRWGFNRDVDSLFFDGVELSSNTSSQAVSGSFTQDNTWTIKGGIQGKYANARAALSFQNKAYWGTGTVAPTNSAGILALPSSSFVTTKTKTSIGYPCYDGKFPIYCIPTRIGVPSVIKVSEEVNSARAQTHFVKFTDFNATSVQFTNSSGFTEGYTVLIFNTLPTESFFLVQWS